MKTSIVLFLSACLSISPVCAPQALAEPATAQSQPHMRAAFEVLSLGHRKQIQDVMALRGHYAGAVDGSYGPATERAIPLTAADFEQIAAGEIHPPKFPLGTREEVARFFDYIISGQADIYLYGT